MTTIVSATDWENFFALRAHPDAQPEFQALADLMLEKYVEARPRSLQAGEWHLPFADKYVEDGLSQEQLVKITSARCARVSYLNFEGDISYEKDYKLHDDLLASGHMSPFEHAAFALSKPERSGNFVGFCQYRKTLPFENRVCNVYSLLKERKAARP
jgi:thymidylate synthase ThyX